MSKKLFINLLAAGVILVSCAPQSSATQAPAAGGETPVEQAPAGQAPVEPFEGFPDEYKDINIPPEILELIQAGKARVLPLPADTGVQKDELYNLVQNDSYLEPYNFERTAEYSDEKRFVGVPWRNNPDYADWSDKGVLVGLVYDPNNFYAKSDKPVYEVWLYDKRAELRDQSGAPVATLDAGKNYFWTESPPDKEILTFFVKNGCWLCWNAGGRCGCLLCF